MDKCDSIGILKKNLFHTLIQKHLVGTLGLNPLSHPSRKNTITVQNFPGHILRVDVHLLAEVHSLVRPHEGAVPGQRKPDVDVEGAHEDSIPFQRRPVLDDLNDGPVMEEDEVVPDPFALGSPADHQRRQTAVVGGVSET